MDGIEEGCVIPGRNYLLQEGVQAFTYRFGLGTMRLVCIQKSERVGFCRH